MHPTLLNTTLVAGAYTGIFKVGFKKYLREGLAPETPLKLIDRGGASFNSPLSPLPSRAGLKLQWTLFFVKELFLPQTLIFLSL